MFVFAEEGGMGGAEFSTNKGSLSLSLTKEASTLPGTFVNALSLLTHRILPSREPRPKRLNNLLSLLRCPREGIQVQLVDLGDAPRKLPGEWGSEAGKGRGQ